MSEKALKVVLAAVGGLIVVYAVAALASRGPDNEAAIEDSALAGTLQAVREVELEGVRIIALDDTIRLELAENRWTVNGYTADSSAVADLQAAVRAARIRHLAATNPTNHGPLGVGEGSARVLELTPTDGEPIRLLIGEAGPSSPSAYVRLPTSDDVYLVDGGLHNPTRRTLDDWRDRTIVRVDTAAVVRIAVTRDGDSYTLERDSAGWRFAQGDAADAPQAGESASTGLVDAQTVGDMLAELADMQAEGFAESGAAPDGGEAGVAPRGGEGAAGSGEGEDAPEEGDEETTRSIAAFSQAGDTLAAVTLTQRGDGSNFLATTPSEETIFEFASWRADRLMPTRAELEPETD